jgi:hypothetical protein
MSSPVCNPDTQDYRAHLSLRCQSFRLVHIRRWPLPDMQLSQLIVTVRVLKYDNEEDTLSLPLTPGRTYKEIHVQRRLNNGQPIDQPRVYFTSIPEEDESFEDEAESKGGSV